MRICSDLSGNVIVTVSLARKDLPCMSFRQRVSVTVLSKLVMSLEKSSRNMSSQGTLSHAPSMNEALGSNSNTTRHRFSLCV